MSEKQTVTKALSICGLCGEQCLIDAVVQDGTIMSVQKAEARPHVNGNICVKGAALKQYVHHKDRIEHPMRRVGPKGSGQYEVVSWDEAIQAIADRLRETKEQFGPEGTIFYVGHPHWLRKTLAELSATYGTPNFCTESSTCHLAMDIAWGLVAGETLRFDAKNCDTMLVWSSNPAYSEKDKMDMVMSLKKRGANIIVVDPRVTPFADAATLHLQLYPGTDGALALGMAHVIIKEGLEDKEYIEKYTYGYEEYKAYVENFPPEKAARITGVPAEKIVQAARMIAAGKTALRTSGCAVVHCVNGVQNQRAAFLLLALTGNIDRPGGNLDTGAPKAALDTFHHALAQRPDVDHDISYGRYPVWNDIINNEGQCIRLADAILKSDPYPIHNFLAFGINVGMWPRPDRIREALKAVEFSVVTELFWNEACETADYVLPCTASPEMDQLITTGDNHVLFVPHIVDPGDKLTDIDIMLRIAHALGMDGDFLGCADYDAYLERTLKTTGLTLAEVKAQPEGVPARILKSGKKYSLETGLNTPTGKVEFCSKVMEKYSDRPGYDALPTYTDWRDVVGDRKKYPFILVAGGRKAHFFHSRTYRLSWLANLEGHTLVCICSKDAETLGVAEGEFVRLSTPIGSKDYMVQLDNGIKPGVVHVCDSDGEQNINLLIDDQYIDPISGFPGFRSYICNLEKLPEAEGEGNA